MHASLFSYDKYTEQCMRSRTVHLHTGYNNNPTQMGPEKKNECTG
jgi:hypothetical protein